MKFKKIITIFLSLIFISSSFIISCDAINKKNEIPIAMATDNNYVTPTLVSIASALKNSNKNTFLKFYILISGDLTDVNKEKFLKIKKYFKNCSIDLIDMGDQYSDSYKGIWGKAMYYRLMLPSILKNEKKCIYLDGDTLILKDLLELYNINVDNYYVAGVPDGCRINEGYAKRIGIKDLNHYICSGVLVWNLEKCREDNIEKKFDDFILQKVNNERVSLFPDQDTINAVCYDKIYELPFKFGAIVGFMYAPRYEKDPFLYKIISKENWLDGMKNTVVIHFVGTKPWNSKKVKFYSDWKTYLEYLNIILSC